MVLASLALTVAFSSFWLLLTGFACPAPSGR